jgi:hypothetical protein
MNVTPPYSNRKKVALITNHGYAGPNPPIGNAPDTGGQNVYVNDLARALEEVGYEVFIFTRGGFPDYHSDIMREGEARMSDNSRYVYIPGGGDQFIRKEDISVALGEEAENLYAYINGLADIMGTEPWQVFDFVNTHYWDAGILGYDLIERWQADFIFEQVKEIFGDGIRQDVFDKYYRATTGITSSAGWCSRVMMSISSSTTRRFRFTKSACPPSRPSTRGSAPLPWPFSPSFGTPTGRSSPSTRPRSPRSWSGTRWPSCSRK